MKRMISAMLVLLLCLSLLPVAAFAASASATLTGPGTVRAGDTITLTFKLKGSGIYGVSGALSYDSGQLTLIETTQKVTSPWMAEFSGNNFVVYDNKLTKPIDGEKTLFTATFKVSSKLEPGTTVKVSLTGVTASDGKADINIGTVTYSKTIAEPLSKDNTLKSLTVSNATISPAFSSDKTSYTATVPFEVSKLQVSAEANDSKAKVSINSPTLTAGGTTKVTVKVTAENGDTKTYTITVSRAQDPNYVASDNNDLSGISVEGFLLSPVFTAERTEYVIWLPYETERVKVSATASDKKASVEVVGGDNLVAGADNEIKVICTAEDGTQKSYTIIAKRAAAHDAGEDTPPVTTGPEPTVPGPTEPSPTEPAPTEPAPTEPEETRPQQTAPVGTQPGGSDQQGNAGTAEPKGIPWWLLALVAALSLIAGVCIGTALEKKKNKQ